ncbi:MAG TPA: 3-oxoacyl-[acyl-carrier-protein] synthase III C-terminal domain-containing protein [Candidatus Bathyarchaeia archaeon]|nr:3-oxoacyl-[acyl-carrier-protein] synthase III C-terminal domain-containing protein [Candidatus Bathyarchaeia archaeon]
MVGITSYGAYIPYLRLPLAAIGGGKRSEGGPEKAVANWDEDAVTMAVAAAIACLQGIDRATVDGVLFASTSYAFKEKQAAAIIAKALDLRRDVLTADLGDSLRAGINALRAAADSIKAGSAKRVLVVIGDTRMAAPRSALEGNLGDGAAAFLLGASEVAADLTAVHTVTDEIIDVWRAEGDPFVHAWEDRFVVDHGYRHSVKEVVKGLLQKSNLKVSDFAKLVLYGPDARSHAQLVRELGFNPSNQVQDPLFGKIGNAGAAFAPLLLTAALEDARPGDRLLVVGYGDGAEALVLEVTPQIDKLRDRRAVRWHLARRGELPSYDVYLRFRHLLATEHDRRASAGISATKHFRDRDEDVSLLAQKCRKCRQVQYPHQRVCFTCFAKDDFDKIRLSDRIGHLKSFTFDNFAGSPNPPLVATVTDVEGARLYLQMTDASPKEAKLDLPVELTFRKIHDAGGTPNYYWKCTPAR